MPSKWYIRRNQGFPGLQLSCLDHQPEDSITVGFDSYEEARLWLARMETREAEPSRVGAVVIVALWLFVITMGIWGVAG